MSQERTDRIIGIDARVERAPIDERQFDYLAPFVASDRTIRSLIVLVELADGRRGEGESTPLATWSGETIEASRTLLDRFLAPCLTGMSVASARENLWSVFAGAPYLLSAIETALANATGSMLTTARVPIRGFIGAVAPAIAAQLAAEQNELGFTVLKVKLTGSLADDRARVRAVRDAAPAATLLVDANEALAPRELDRYARLFVEAHVSGVEQPIPRDAALRLGLPVARGWHWIADESLWGVEDALTQRDGPWDVWTVHSAKARGLARLAKVASIAAESGIALVSGSHMHIAAGVPSVCRIADRFPDSPARRLLADDVCAPVIVADWSYPDVVVGRGSIRIV